MWCPCCRILDGSRLHRHCTHGCKGYQPLQEKVDTDFILVTANTAQQHIASWQLRMIEAQSLVYQAWMQAGFCTTHLWCCMWACLNDCRELYLLSLGDNLSGFSGLTIQAVLRRHTDLSFLASNTSCVWYCLRLLRIDALLLSNTVDITKLSRLEREKTCVFVATDVLAPGYLMQH